MNIYIKHLLLLIIIGTFYPNNSTFAYDYSPYKVQLSLAKGFPFKKYNTGITSGFNNKTSVIFSPAYSFELGLLLGYKLNNNIETSLSTLYQYSDIQPPINNGTGTFTKLIFQPNITYILQGRYMTFNFSLGLPYALRPIFDIDASKIPGCAHNKFYYKNSVGLSFSPQLVFKSKQKRFSYIMGGTIYYNKFQFDHMTSNGIKIPSYIVTNSPDFSNIRSLNGGGVNFIVGICYHFELKNPEEIIFE